jgi:Undecaprenyl-phosphate glucose phosphotransferase
MLPLTIRLCPDWIGFQVLHREVVQLSGVPLLTLAEQPLSGWRLLLKDLVDRVLALMILIMAAPLLLGIAVAIKLDTRGPVFYRQQRHGFNREVIQIFKFRTMYADRCDDGIGAPVIQATKNDTRITRVGRYLRCSSLDELPQVLNVLKGDMSIVGPRPHAVAHNEYYGTLIDTYLARHKVKPGITGWAQVNGLRGETDTLDKMEKRVQHDLYYITNWSLWLDAKIVLQTLFVSFVDRAAY